MTSIQSAGGAIILYEIPGLDGGNIVSGLDSGIRVGNYFVLGLCETSPTIRQTEALHAGFNTLGGVTPYAYVRGGGSATISCTLTKWDDANMELLKRLATSGLSPVRMGAIIGLDTNPAFPNKYSLSLYVQFIKPVYGNIVAWGFPNCRVASVRRSEIGALPEKADVEFAAYRKLLITPESGGTPSDVRMVLRTAYQSPLVSLADVFRDSNQGSGGGE